MMIRPLPLVLSMFLSLGTLPAAAAERVFFTFDDESIPRRNNLKLTMVTADRYPGNPVLTRGPKGALDHAHAENYGSVLHIDGKLRMWFLAMPSTKLEHSQPLGFGAPCVTRRSMMTFIGRNWNSASWNSTVRRKTTSVSWMASAPLAARQELNLAPLAYPSFADS